MKRTSTSLPPVPLKDLARYVTETQGWAPKALQVLDPLWQVFVQFVLAQGTAPHLPSGISERTLAAFAAHCDQGGAVPFEEAPLVLGAARLVLFRAGLDLHIVDVLRAPRRRLPEGYKTGALYKAARKE